MEPLSTDMIPEVSKNIIDPTSRSPLDGTLIEKPEEELNKKPKEGSTKETRSTSSKKPLVKDLCSSDEDQTNDGLNLAGTRDNRIDIDAYNEATAPIFGDRKFKS